MAKQLGMIKVEGLLDGFSFYSSVYGNIVRRKGGASKEKIRKSPKFKRLREHQSEFSGCARAGKLWRQGLGAYTKNAPDHTLVWRVTQLMNKIKDFDDVSERGKRDVSKGMIKDESKTLLKDFDLNSKAPLQKILKKKVKSTEVSLQLKGFVSREHLVAPKSATHAQLTAIASYIDFEGNKHVVTDNSVEIALDGKARDITLAPSVINSRGFKIYLLQICFLQKINKNLLPLIDRKYNVLSVVGVY